MAFDRPSIQSRLRSLLPKGWFPDAAPNLDAILASLATTWSWIAALICAVRSQSRLETASGLWLDFAARDYLGTALARKIGESDTAFRQRISDSILLRTTTRLALTTGISRLTGYTVRVFEPARCADTGAYGATDLASIAAPCAFSYGECGGWGSLTATNQIFITISTSPQAGEPRPSGYCNITGGYGGGSIFFNQLETVRNRIADIAVIALIHRLIPVNCIAWTRFR